MVILVTLLFAVALLPLLYALKGNANAKKKKLALLMNIASVFAVVLLVTIVGFTGSAAAAGDAGDSASFANGMAFLGAGLVTGFSCLGAGIGIAGAASAAIGAISENEKIFGKSLIIVVLAEGVAIYGMLVSLLILGRV